MTRAPGPKTSKNSAAAARHGKAIDSNRKKRIGIVSINRQWTNPSGMNFTTLYNGIGKNTGNLMFTEAAFLLIDGVNESIGFSFDPKEVNKNFDAVVVPAANWLNDYADWDWLIERLADLKVPVTVIGLGLQSPTYELGAVRVNDSCRRLIEFFASQPGPISVRGNFTRDWLRSIGVENVVTTGCPSIYMNIFGKSETPEDGKVIFQGTRYGLAQSFLSSTGINRRMFGFAVEFDCPMVYQSEPEEMELLTSGASASSLGTEKCDRLKQLYSCKTVEELDGVLTRLGRVFYDLKAWSRFVSSHRAVVGTRLHGAILALNSGRPAVLVPHDSRTAEVASFAGIQSLHGPDVRDCTSFEEIVSMISGNNLERYSDTRSNNQSVFIQFLRDSGLTARTDRMF